MIRFGIIGAGRIAHTFAQAITATSGKIHAVASRDINRAKSFQKAYGIERAYDSYQALYKDSAVDIVYVATPHGLHEAQMQEALTYQKALLTEKAFTLNAAQARGILERANAQNVFVMEAMWTRFLPVIQAVQDVLETGTIGPLKELHATFSFAGDLNKAGRLVNPHLGGGALLDVGIYPLTVADLFGTLDGTITSDVKQTDTGVDGWNQIHIHTPDSKMVLESGILEDKPRHATLIGTQGRIEIPAFWSAQEAFVYTHEGTLITHINTPHVVNGFEYEIQAVIDDLEAGRIENTIMPHATTLRLLDVMDQLRQSWGVRYPSEKV